MRLKKKEKEKASSVDPDELAHMGHLIWIYTVCQDLVLRGLLLYAGAAG